MSQLTLEQLQHARQLAIDAVKESDGGSSNLDTVELYGVWQSNLPDLGKQAGLLIIKYPGHYTIMAPLSQYQGFNRTRQVEAIANYLHDTLNLKAFVSYALD